VTSRSNAALWALTLLTLVGAIAAALAGASAPAGAWRVAFALGFLALGPGLGWAGAMRLPSAPVTLLVGAAVSVSLTLLVAIAMAATDTWSIAGGFAVLAATGAVGAVAWLVRCWHPPPPEGVTS